MIIPLTLYNYMLILYASLKYRSVKLYPWRNKMKNIIQEIFQNLGISQYKENTGILQNHIENILNPIPISELGHSKEHFIEHIKLCLPDGVRGTSDANISHYLNYECNSSDVRGLFEKAAKNMREQRELVKEMLRAVGVNKDEIGDATWKDTIRHVVDGFGAMKPEELKPLIHTITVAAEKQKDEHADVKYLFSKVIQEYRDLQAE